MPSTKPAKKEKSVSRKVKSAAAAPKKVVTSFEMVVIATGCPRHSKSKAGSKKEMKGGCNCVAGN